MGSLFSSISSSLSSAFFGEHPDESLRKRTEEMKSKLGPQQNKSWAIKESPLKKPSQTSYESQYSPPEKIQSVSVDTINSSAVQVSANKPRLSVSNSNLTSSILEKSASLTKSALASSSISSSLTPATQASVKLIASGFKDSLSAAVSRLPVPIAKAGAGLLEIIKKQSSSIFGTAFKVLGNIPINDPATQAMFGLAVPVGILLLPQNKKFLRDVIIRVTAEKEPQTYTFTFGKDNVENSIVLKVQSGKPIPPFRKDSPFYLDGSSKSTFSIKALGLLNLATLKVEETHCLYTIIIYDPNIKQRSDNWHQLSKDSFIRAIHTNKKHTDEEITAISKENDYNEIDVSNIVSDSREKHIKLRPFKEQNSNEYVNITVR